MYFTKSNWRFCSRSGVLPILQLYRLAAYQILRILHQRWRDQGAERLEAMEVAHFLAVELHRWIADLAGDTQAQHSLKQHNVIYSTPTQPETTRHILNPNTA